MCDDVYNNNACMMITLHDDMYQGWPANMCAALTRNAGTAHSGTCSVNCLGLQWTSDQDPSVGAVSVSTMMWRMQSGHWPADHIASIIKS